tara:strand:- start:311 stop:928 length:618 start_codon:yes stop_codon:yes gene_type:complete
MITSPLNRFPNLLLKRFFDIFCSITFLLLFWWIYFLIAISIKISSPGPVIFKQQRRGKSEKLFYCYKFRSMYFTKEESINITSINDNRVYSLGRVLRRYNLDELPQFFNVLKGDMSLVGPRPFMLIESNELLSKIEKYRLRYTVLPGITGFAAIKGYRGGTSDIKLMEDRINLDIEYIKNWSIFFDIKICFLTIKDSLFGTIKGY